MPRDWRSTKIGSLIGVIGVALAGAAVIAHRHAREAERCYPLRGGSHMVHHIAPERIVHAIDLVAAESSAWQPQAS
jgi:hypothetical protein